MNSIAKKIIEEIKSGRIKTASLLNVNNENDSYMARQCKIVKVIEIGNEVIIKMKPWKGYPLGHKYLYRSFDEVIL